MPQPSNIDDDLRSTISLDHDQLNPLSRPAEEEDGHIDNFISDFLKRHQIGGDPNSEVSPVAVTQMSPAGKSWSSVASNLPTEATTPTPAEEPGPRPSAATNAANARSAAIASASAVPVQDDLARRNSKSTESVDDLRAMRQLANTIANCVLESHGRVVVTQRALTLFVAAIACVVASTAMAIAASDVQSAMFVGALVRVALATYATGHFWWLTDRLKQTRADRIANH